MRSTSARITPFNVLPGMYGTPSVGRFTVFLLTVKARDSRMPDAMCSGVQVRKVPLSTHTRRRDPFTGHLRWCTNA